jgi:hypothetical protein
VATYIYRRDLDGRYKVEDTGYSLSELKNAGYTTDYESLGKNEKGVTVSETTSGDTSGVDFKYAMAIANTLYSFMPANVVKKFAEGYVKYGGDKDLALAYTRNTKEYQDEFSYLMNDDGTLKMTEIEAIGVMESYKNTLSEVGINDFSDFTEKFKQMVGTTSPLEFQQRIDFVYNNVIDKIPEVKELFATQMGIEADNATIFASLINPDIEDKVLTGTIETVNIAAEATSRGFGYSFAKFNKLKKQGMNVESARKLYETAGDFITKAGTIGRELDLETLEAASLGDLASTNRIKRIESELISTYGLSLGAAQKDGKVTGLIT